jgi:ATP-dependent RNA helicase HelY
VTLPTPYAPQAKAFALQVATALRAVPLRADGLVGVAGPAVAATAPAEALEAHPCASCADLRSHVRAAERADRLAAESARLERTIRGRTESLARQFDRVLRVLEAWGYVDGWALTDAGQRLARVYHECDLLIAESLAGGVLDGLDPAAVAGLVSTFTYEPRGPGGSGPNPWFPSRRVRERWQAIEALAAELHRAEQEAGLPVTRAPDAGFVALAYAWAAGEELGEVIAEEEISGGDFVRNIKQLIDLLGQIGDLAPDPATAASARQAADRIFRGVVAASSAVPVPETDLDPP